MLTMRKTIIVFSNPFGYGPTGNAIPVLETLSKLKNVDLIFAGSGLCLEILPSKYKSFILNERDETEIENFLNTFENPYVIGIQNRFSIKVCKRNNISCAFLDVLAWFWKKIPEDHLIADEIFWLNFGSMETKEEYTEKINLISGIVEKSSFKNIKKDKENIIVHIGGANYPVIDGIPKNYLKLVSLSLNELSDKNLYKNIYFVTGKESANYVRSLGINNDVKVDSFSRENYLNILNHSNHLLTTAGVSSTLEGFYYNIPVSFLLPINLSHLALTNLLEERNLQIHKLDWNNYVKINEKLEQLTEKEGIKVIEACSEIVLSDTNLLNKYLRDFINLAENIPVLESQKIFINKIGYTGSKEMVEILTEKWNLT
jgi:hypothetical protein